MNILSILTNCSFSYLKSSYDKPAILDFSNNLWKTSLLHTNFKAWVRLSHFYAWINNFRAVKFLTDACMFQRIVKIEAEE